MAPSRTALLSPAAQPSSAELALRASSTRTTTTSRRPLLGFLGRSSSSAYTVEEDASFALEQGGRASVASLRDEEGASAGEEEINEPEAPFDVRVGVLVLMPAEEGREDVGGGMDVGSTELCVLCVRG